MAYEIVERRQMNYAMVDRRTAHLDLNCGTARRGGADRGRIAERGTNVRS